MNNIKNKLIQETDVEAIISGIVGRQLKVNNIENFTQAFVHKSFFIKEGFTDEDDECCAFYFEPSSSNERLEFLGDSILNFNTAEYVYQLFPSKEEGFLTKLRTRLVRNTQLSFIGNKLGFEKWLLISNSVENMNGRSNPRLIEDIFESFIAALYKDQGFYITREFIFGCFDRFVDVNQLVENNDNYKDMLLRYFQLNAWSHPVYETTNTTGNGPTKTFTTVVLVKRNLCESSNEIDSILDINTAMETELGIAFEHDYMLGSGTGKTKKESQQQASKSALEMLNVPKNF
jgi:ribonuclease-3